MPSFKLFYRPDSLSTNRLALTRFKAWSCFVNDIDAALATNKFAVAMTSFKRLKRILDFHVHHRSGYWPVTGLYNYKHNKVRSS